MDVHRLLTRITVGPLRYLRVPKGVQIAQWQNLLPQLAAAVTSGLSRLIPPPAASHTMRRSPQEAARFVSLLPYEASAVVGGGRSDVSCFSATVFVH